MNKLFKYLIISLMISVITLSANSDIPLTVDYQAKSVLYRENIDLDAKSLKGWLRVFNSHSKLRNYEIYVDDSERKLVIIYLTKLFNLENNKYAKRVR